MTRAALRRPMRNAARRLFSSTRILVNGKHHAAAPLRMRLTQYSLCEVSLSPPQWRETGTSLHHCELSMMSAAGETMAHVTYKIVRHEDGWAYSVDGAFSESFPTHAQALAAARRAAAEQRAPGQTEAIEYEDEKGTWHTETARGDDRPETDVQDGA